MNREMLADHLLLATKHVEEGARHVLRQRALVAELKRDGHDTGEAERLLAKFEELHTMHRADRDRLARELAELEQSAD